MSNLDPAPEAIALLPDVALPGIHRAAGLQTVSWLFEGLVLHRDSLGSRQLIRPGEPNLMTAGQGIAHSEESAAGHRPRLPGARGHHGEAPGTGPLQDRHGPHSPMRSPPTRSFPTDWPACWRWCTW